MSGSSSIEHLSAMATIPSPFASTCNQNNNQSLQSIGTTSSDVDDVSTSPTPSETTTEGSTNAVVFTGVINGTEYNNLRWEDCDYNEDGEPIGIDNKTRKQIQVVKLHKTCSKLQVYGVKNAKKDNIIESILTTYKNNVAYNTLKEMTMDNGSNKENIVTNQPNQPTAPRKNISVHIA
jgi:hypothetical protein